MSNVPQVQVGIMHEPSVEFVLHGNYKVNGIEVTGNQTATMQDGKV